jgi:hypothetical protein
MRALPPANISRRDASAPLFSGMAQIPQFLPAGSMDLGWQGRQQWRSLAL